MTTAVSWVVRNGDYYYMTFSLNDNITLYRSKTLTYVYIVKSLGIILAMRS